MYTLILGNQCAYDYKEFCSVLIGKEKNCKIGKGKSGLSLCHHPYFGLACWISYHCSWHLFHPLIRHQLANFSNSLAFGMAQRWPHHLHHCSYSTQFLHIPPPSPFAMKPLRMSRCPSVDFLGLYALCMDSRRNCSCQIYWPWCGLLPRSEDCRSETN